MATNGSKIVSLGIEEQVSHEDLGGLNDGRLAGTELLVDLLESFLTDRGIVLQRFTLAGVFLESSVKLGFFSEYGGDLIGRLDAQRTDKDRNGKLAVFVDTYVEYVVGVGLVLEPSASVGDDRSGIGLLTGLVVSTVVIDSGGTDDLRNDNTLCAVNDEGTLLGHDGEVTHEDCGLLNFTGELVGKTNVHSQGDRVGNDALLALLNGVLGVCVKRITYEFNNEVSGVIRDRGNVVQDFHESFIEEPLI